MFFEQIASSTLSTTSSASSTTGSSTVSNNNYINHASANTTTTSTSGDGVDSVSPLNTTCSNKLTHKPSTCLKSPIPTIQNANLIEQLTQQQHQYMHLSSGNNKQTLSRQKIFENIMQQNNNIGRSNQEPHSPLTQSKFNNARFGTMNSFGTNNGICQYVDLNGQTSSIFSQPPPLPPSSNNQGQQQATTAYLVQTPTGSALLIPPQTALNPTNHFIQTNASQHSANTIALTLNNNNNNNNNNNSSNGNPYGITTIPLQTAANILNSNNNVNTAMLAQSPSFLNTNCFNRPESTASTNVYQTIDTTEK